jgi:zinc resistance-associated protein
MKIVLAGTMALIAAFSAPTYAQQTAAEREHWRQSETDITALVDAGIAALKVGLQLTPNQERNWPAVEQAMRDIAKAHEQRMGKGRSPPHPVDPIEAMRTRADRMSVRAAGLKHFADAAAPLYSSLDEDQKQRFRVLLRAIAPHHQQFDEWREHRGREDDAE